MRNRFTGCEKRWRLFGGYCWRVGRWQTASKTPATSILLQIRVYTLHTTLIEQQVAIKELNDDACDDEKLAEFKKEFVKTLNQLTIELLTPFKRFFPVVLGYFEYYGSSVVGAALRCMHSSETGEKTAFFGV